METQTIGELKYWKRLNEMDDIEEHKNDIKVSVPPFDAERAAELELVEKLVDLVRAVVRKARA